jgi:hypothetical protein
MAIKLDTWAQKLRLAPALVAGDKQSEEWFVKRVKISSAL